MATDGYGVFKRAASNVMAANAAFIPNVSLSFVEQKEKGQSVLLFN